MRGVVRFLLFILFGGIISTTIQGQPEQYGFRQISIDQGLPGQNVLQVFQDHNGIIWISVEAIGLCRYDGLNFELFNYSGSNKESLSNNFVSSIIEDGDSNLWVATENGLNKYLRNSNTFKRYYSDSTIGYGLSSNLVNSLYVDRNKNLWVCTGDGLCKYNSDNDIFEQIDLQSDGATLSIITIFEHTSGEFYIGTNRGVILYNPKSKDIIQWSATSNAENGPIHNRIRSISEDSRGNLWIGTHRGINKFNTKSKTFEVWSYNDEDKEEFEDEGYNSQFSIDRRYIWFSSYTSGIVVIDTETNTYKRILKNSNYNGSLKSNHIRSVVQDRSGLLWISTKFEGLFIYDRRKEMFNRLPEKYSLFHPLKNMHILSFYKDSYEGVYWVGTKYNGLFKVDLNTGRIRNYIHNINNNSSIGSNRIQAIYRDSYGYLWVGLANGLDLFEEKSGKFRHINQIFIDDILQDSQGALWIGTSEGVFVVNYDNFTLERFKEIEHDFFENDALHVMYIFADKIGRIWFSTRFNGLYRYIPDSHKFSHFSPQSSKTGFYSDAVRGISEDISGNIWVGTKSDGVCIYDTRKETFSYLSTDDGLPSNFILSIQQDQDFNFWFGTHNGLSYYNNTNKKFTNYTILHGLQGNIFEVGVNGMFSDGFIFFGGHNGLNIFHPDNIVKHNLRIPDSLLITSIKIADKEILRDVTKNISLDLKHNQNYLTLEFILVDYYEPIRHKFKYRMLGVSDKWIDLGNKNYVAFSGLQPGAYQFEISGTNEFGVSNKIPLVVSFDIHPPMVKTWWFRGIIMFVISFIGLMIVRARVQRSRNFRKYLELQIKERTEKLRNVNEELVERNSLIETQNKEIEENKSLLEEKVAVRTKDLELAKIKAEESDRLKSSFIANISHEIRTPLNAILGFSSLIIESVSEDEALTPYYESVSVNSAMLLKIIDDVLDISKLESGQIVIEKKEFKLVVFMSEVYNTFKEQFSQFQNSAINFIFNNPLNMEEDLIVYTDKYRLRQVLFNLLSNAIKFTKNGYVEIGFIQDLDRIKFYVKDSGIGIKKEHFNSIFDRFNKIEDSDILYRGNGLGLSLSHDLVKLLEGEIWLESLYGLGSSFYFTIPSEKTHLVKSKKSSKSNTPQKLKLVSGRAILIVEDEESNYRLLAEMLKNTFENILWASNGMEALDILANKEADKIKIIFLDIKMPILDGYKTFKRIKELGLETPIVAVTAYAQAKDKEKIKDYGFDYYISKPIIKENVLSVINYLL